MPTDKSTYNLTAIATAILLSAPSAFAGSDAASPTPIIPPIPPTLGTGSPQPVVTQQMVQAAQALVVSLRTNPPASLTVSLQARLLNVLMQSIDRPEILAQIGMTADEVRALILQVQRIPTVSS